jgi:hypothetical protein
MPDWKSAEDYAFTTALTPEGWAWEFLRRNADYSADFASIQSKDKKALRKARKELGKGARLLFTAKRYVAMKWRIDGEARDLVNDTPPEFQVELPDMPTLSEVMKYFEPPDEVGHASRRAGFAVLVFNLKGDPHMQLFTAWRMLEKLRKDERVASRKKNLKPGQFKVYLRLLDATAANASTLDIIKYIGHYKAVAKKTNAEWGWEAQNRVNRDIKKAKALVAEPWRILLSGR